MVLLSWSRRRCEASCNGGPFSHQNSKTAMHGEKIGIYANH